MIRANKTLIMSVFFVLFICDLGFSALQYFYSTLDGDLAGSVILSAQLEPLFSDPFGIKALLEGTVHANPNRYFSHLLFKFYYEQIPLILNPLVGKELSLFYSISLFKLFTHILIVYSICKLTLTSFKKNWSLALFLAFSSSAFLIAGGAFYHQLAIIDITSTYVFFYGFPMGLLLYSAALFKGVLLSKKDSRIRLMLLSVMALVLPFTGPLVAPSLLILMASLTLINFRKLPELFKAKRLIFTIAILCGLVSLYSLYLGRINAISVEPPSVSESYLLYLEGLGNMFHKLGLPILLIGLAVLISFTWKRYSLAQKNLVKALVIFCFVYLCLLPLGGFKPSRQHFIRFDTFLPVNLILIWIIALCLKVQYEESLKRLLTLASFPMIFMISDGLNSKESLCQQNQLSKLVSNDAALDMDYEECMVLTWPQEGETQLTNEKLRALQYWRIIE